ncbi:cupin domain-containing protein [Aestuariispira ectoiniformans]|uniref:cupin domain-containing protein n=1 Tax=Aestuariispira ectoiniformans TaxID=2775080 RepID=UPI00223B4912|nr:cupin domain-containing protein [Aestuariispira ectoiniformans]
MGDKHYSSVDFGIVRDHLKPEKVDKLIHQDVMGLASTENDDISEDRKHLVKLVDLPSKVLSMTIGGLEPKQSTRRHRHNYETVLYVLEGHGVSIIEDQEVIWKAGDAVYVPVWTWHNHVNLSESENALYVACENAPQLLNLGIALREEEAE